MSGPERRLASATGGGRGGSSGGGSTGPSQGQATSGGKSTGVGVKGRLRDGSNATWSSNLTTSGVAVQNRLMASLMDRLACIMIVIGVVVTLQV